MAHLHELRSRVVKAVAAVAVGTVIAFIFNEQILNVLTKPYQLAVPEGSLAFFKPTEAFATVMRLSMYGGAILASPVIIYQSWRFISPGLNPNEKRWAYPVTAVFVSLFAIGIGVGYVALERGLGFLLEFGGDALTPIIGADFYLKFAMRFILAFGLAFEFPVFLFGAAAIGVVSSKSLRSNRRWALLIILIAAAFITPSGDPMTLMLLSAPLYVLYELTILAIRFILRR